MNSQITEPIKAGKFTITNLLVKFTHESSKNHPNLVFHILFKAEFLNSSVLLEAGLGKWGGQKIYNYSRTAGLVEENKQEKACRRNCAWITFQLITRSPTIYWYSIRLVRSLCQHHCYRCQVPKVLQNPSLLLTQIFLPAGYNSYSFIHKANCHFFNAFSIVPRWFCFFELKSTKVCSSSLHFFASGLLTH